MIQYDLQAPLAHSVERFLHTEEADGSIPSWGTEAW